ncbi:phosphate acyltransferase PlsX [Candidatus Stoquefichus sp. SB1]|uniref:phosphate acyltransferase PlsX n=1 Tax=Candidatus Stoquefichus sp. SB1 TaxID=1658109 RepID=UPI00067E815E|nr:phosphate acyltransferase PlsX [Candidatus Stoquefichus sp. SB1]
MYKLSIDAMSGDLGSGIVVDACIDFINTHADVELYVTGKAEELEKLKTYERIHIVDARDIVPMDAGIMSVRRKKDSSMVKAVALANDGIVDGVVSCGSTGAFYTSAMLFLKRIEGVEKSCLMAILPTYNEKGVALLDVGANAENTPEQLQEFAIMGHIYAKNIRGIAKPKVALLNIGTEAKKGDEVHQKAYQLLESENKIHFIGNIEGRDILKGDCDVIVTDGFSGNIALKTCEGAASLLMKMVKEGMMSSFKGKMGALLAKSSLYALKDKFDYKSVGGALMMGFEKAVVKAHGASDAKAFCNAMDLAYQMVKLDVVSQMKEGLNTK